MDRQIQCSACNAVIPVPDHVKAVTLTCPLCKAPFPNPNLAPPSENALGTSVRPKLRGWQLVVLLFLWWINVALFFGPSGSLADISSCFFFLVSPIILWLLWVFRPTTNWATSFLAGVGLIVFVFLALLLFAVFTCSLQGVLR